MPKLRTDAEALLAELEELNRKQQEAEIVWIGEPVPTLWQTFEKHALGIVGGVLLAAALVYLLAFVRGW